MLNGNQLESLVYAARRRQFAHTEGLVRSNPLNIDSQGHPWLQFFLEIPGSAGPEKIIGWALTDLITEARYEGVHIFVDCTFSCVPNGFKQCLIFMVYNAPTDLYLPVFYVLMTRKDSNLYSHVFQNIISAANWQIFGKSVTCDFEQALMNAVQIQFAEARLIGCFFHWKQVRNIVY